ncbi:glutamate synthase subunit beta [Bacillus sp. PK3_68]|uniref:glutamate synthase subunit beta n=1 Tax=Bacillus sp. PK3_68 TaxID=2027408 RepID=UPI000E766DF6|nr:glutamate synthase subunit beta [Bacillus sp. PK3_68]RJS61895.1 glutamate synthase [Bacillus sp. PK3_68]
MGKAAGFIEYKREVPGERDPGARLSDWKEYQQSLPEGTLQKQGARCMDCGTPFCHTGVQWSHSTIGCPLYNLIPEWNDLVYQGRWQEALNRLVKTNNFPEFTGRVCPAPCEGSCTAAISDSAVAIKSIEKAIVDKGFKEGWIIPKPPRFRTGKTIAVIGSGPAGLACADELNKKGHSVTVFERSDRVGGLLTYGIPNMKLEKEVVDRRVRLLEAEGIQFVTNKEVGKDMSVKQLQEQYHAIVLCTGAQKHRDLSIEGRGLAGIHFAMDYLTNATKKLLNERSLKEKAISATGKDVIVIGGGDTGADCVATALRQRCKSVVQFGKHPQPPATRSAGNPWPEYPHIFSLDYAYAESNTQLGKDPREYSILTKKLIGDKQGRVKELHTVQVKKVTDGKGQLILREVPGSEKVWPAQLVFIAVGFSGPEEDVIQAFQLTQDKRSTVQTPAGRYSTNVKGVFAAGDVRRGQSLVVWAIQEGRSAAWECDRYLMEKAAQL